MTLVPPEPIPPKEGWLIMRQGWLSLLLASSLFAVACAGGSPTEPASPALPGEPAAGGPEGQSRREGATGSSDLSLEAIAQYRGSDRQEVLERKAREEGTLNYYGVLGEDEKELFDRFEERYTYLDVVPWGPRGENILERVLAEHRAGKLEADVIDSGATNRILGQEGVLIASWSPNDELYPEHWRDPSGRYHIYRLSTYTPIFNTNAVRREELPDSFEGFLDPKWKGKIAFDDGDWDWFKALTVRHFGEERGLEFFRKLEGQNPIARGGHTLLAQLVAAGEVVLNINGYNWQAAKPAAQGAPIDWYPLEPIYVRPAGVSMTVTAPHPAAAMLWIDFVTSREGQEILSQVGYIPAHPDVETNPPGLGVARYETITLTDEEFFQDQDRWIDLYAVFLDPNRPLP